jgi:hypothetical protein
MSTRFPDDVILPPDALPAPKLVRPARVLAFVPIAVALAGVGAILIGSLSIGGTAPRAVTASAPKVDPVTTGSVTPSPSAPKDIAEILRRLDD